MTRKCPTCRMPGMKVSRGPYRYDAGGLRHVILLGVETGRCEKCGAESVSIPRMAELHEAIALALAKKAERLLASEVRFLRKYLGLSTEDLAARLAVARETLSRWQSLTAPQEMNETAERLLRLMVLRERPVEEYPTERLAEIRPEANEEPLRFEAGSAGWREAA
jgi:putative zinc finger/helix-turn-helix YgiT family protein